MNPEIEAALRDMEDDQAPASCFSDWLRELIIENEKLKAEIAAYATASVARGN